MDLEAANSPRVFGRGPGYEAWFLTPRWESISTVGNVAAQPGILVSGKVRLGGRAYTLKGAPGGQQHTWGTTHAREWNWGYASGDWGWVDGATSRVVSRLGRELR